MARTKRFAHHHLDPEARRAQNRDQTPEAPPDSPAPSPKKTEKTTKARKLTAAKPKAGNSLKSKRKNPKPFPPPRDPSSRIAARPAKSNNEPVETAQPKHKSPLRSDVPAHAVKDVEAEPEFVKEQKPPRDEGRCIAAEQTIEQQKKAKAEQLANRPVPSAKTARGSVTRSTARTARRSRLPPMGSNFGDGDDSENIRVQIQNERKQVANDGDVDIDDSPSNDLEELGRRAEAAKNARAPNYQELANAEGWEITEEDLRDIMNDETADEEEIDEGVIDYNDHHPSEHVLEDDSEELKALEGEKVVISLDSDDEDATAKATLESSKLVTKDAATRANETDLFVYPWRVEGFGDSMRITWENMFSQAEERPICGSWNVTESYQREKDLEMARYLKDFPIDQWLIPKEQAEQAYRGLFERQRLRRIKVNIYGPAVPEIIQNSAPYSTSQMGGGIPQGGMPSSGIAMQPYYRQTSMSGNHAPSTPQGGPGGTGLGSMSSHPDYRPPSIGGRRAPSTAQGSVGKMGPPPARDSRPQMPPPQQVLPSQPNAMPTRPSPSHGLPGHHQHPQMMGQSPQFGHPQHVGGPHGMSYQASQHYSPYPPHVGHANVPIHHPQPMPGMAYGMSGMTQGMPPHVMIPGMHGHGPNAGAPATRGRKKKESPPAGTPPPPPPTPPYEKTERPVERKKFNKTGKKNMRKQAEADDFPWHREIDYKKAREEAAWDTSGYDKTILDNMAEIRRLNAPVITKLDVENTEKQKMTRNKNKAGASGMNNTPALGGADDEDDDGGPGASNATLNTRKRGENIGGDPYYSGNYSFATEGDRRKALALQYKTPDDIIDAAEDGKIDWDLCMEIQICWNPGKRGTTQELVQGTFRVYDTLITRKQLSERPVITRRGAECIIDFCPHLLWRETLLRIVSEAGCGNKDVRDRFCFNGCYADKATVTKRIAAALGQKQLNTSTRKKGKDAPAEAEEQQTVKGKKRGPAPKSDGSRYLEGEEAWHNGNKEDFEKYIAFFGKRSGHHRVAAGQKRKRRDDEVDALAGPAGSGSGEEGGASKKTKEETSPVSSALSEVMSGDEQIEEDDQEDAVSEQSDGVLDEIED